MANVEIDDLPSKATPAGTDEIEIQETAGGTSKKATLTATIAAISLNTANEYTKAQNFNRTVLTDAATIAWDVSANQTCKVTLTASRTMGTPTGLEDGLQCCLTIIQGGSGSYIVTWPSVFKFTGGVAPTTSTAVGAIDKIFFESDGTNLEETGRSLGIG